ncbi:MAG: GNAT family N-acetyltransferase [Eubacteriales bacterium]|jgi:RimJ/RimL family protein N-acetyltransferase|nr:GNAT family N-acetyltransferase [Eubacteriales bacterium]
MLDKSVEYFHVLMHREKGLPIPPGKLPGGYRIVLFKPGDEKDWAEIETSVGEFEDTDEAGEYFGRKYLVYLPELERRALFVETPEGRKCATATAWWSYTGIRRDPWLHWVSVKPEEQGKGLGKAIVCETLRLMTAIEGERDFYLHTQTWSYKAIGIYLKCGFRISRTDGLGGYWNEYKQALPILKRKLAPDISATGLF